MSTPFPLQISLTFLGFSQFPAPLFPSPKTCPESARLIRQDETITRRVIPVWTMGCGQVVEAPVSLVSSCFPLMSPGSETTTSTLANNALPPSTIKLTAGMQHRLNTAKWMCIIFYFHFQFLHECACGLIGFVSVCARGYLHAVELFLCIK